VDTLLGQLGELWGPSGLIIGFLVVAVAYLYKRVEALQKENTDTLKLVLPIMEKFQTTMDATLRAWDRKGGEQ
jgi:hypothetical protein